MRAAFCLLPCFPASCSRHLELRFSHFCRQFTLKSQQPHSPSNKAHPSSVSSPSHSSDLDIQTRGEDLTKHTCPNDRSWYALYHPSGIKKSQTQQQTHSSSSPDMTSASLPSDSDSQSEIQGEDLAKHTSYVPSWWDMYHSARSKKSKG